MQRKLIATALVGAVIASTAGSVFAQTPGTSQVTREQVRAELQQAREQGLLPVNDYDYPALTQQPGTAKSRDQVYQELVRARANGEMKHSNP